MKKLMLAVLVFILIGLTFGTVIQAESGVRYDTYTLSDGRFVRTQTAYTAISNHNEVYGEPLNRPNDIFIDDKDNVYIASTDEVSRTGKIIKFNLQNERVKVIGEDFLINPTGIYVNKDGDIYVADSGGKVAYKLTQSGGILQRYTKPDSPLFGSDEFQPRKIVADLRGNVYLLINGSKGLAQFTDDNTFLGYFGTNSIQPSLELVLKYIFYTDEQLDRMVQLAPPEISNMSIDDRGLIHTVSLGVEGTGVKRLNISGDNLLGSVYALQDLEDIYIGPIGNIYTVSKSGYIYEYDIEGNLLFAFGGQDESNQTKGLFNVPSGIAVDKAYNLYVLDGPGKELQIFTPTGFADLIHHALELYQDGKYIDSKEPWEQVLKMNDMFDLAHKGLGNAYYSLGEYQLALEEFSIAHERDGYSDAFWEVRNAYLIDNVGIMLTIFFVFLLLYLVNMKLHFFNYVFRPAGQAIRYVRSKSKILDEMLFVFTYLRNPADATYLIKRKNRVGILSASLLLIIFFGFYIYYIYTLGFLFNQRNLAEISLLEESLKVFLPLLLFVVANYLVGSIHEGEGRFRDVYVTTIFAVAPIFFAFPILAMLSHALTYNESFLISFGQTIAILVSAVYFFFMVKETHYYSVKETLISIFISVFTMIIMLLGAFIVYILLRELGTLIIELIREVYYRV
ncbi:MAG: hypothetical protein JXB20_06005 [Bacilli bacterium]|nr:hypothetical protein [Bacilli bacterium]MBN2696024.1 hypothetical protein [Bacilli bacterium]